jgi:hypothetical protein
VTQFEYNSIGVSIVLALSVARLLEGLRDSFDPTRRYWIHALWVIGKLLNTAHYFWAGWIYRNDVEGWNFAAFLGLVVPPGIIFLQVHALLTAHPDGVTDWRTHFWQVRRWFFAANAALPVLNSLLVYVVIGRKFPSAEAAPLAVTLVVSILGLASSNERLHVAIALLYLLSLGLGLGGLFLDAG